MHMHGVYVQVCKGACAHAYMPWDDCGCLGLAFFALLTGDKFSHWIWSNTDSQQAPTIHLFLISQALVL